MEQLIMQTQQSADLKPKLSVKKSQQSKEKKTDFGEALQQQAAAPSSLKTEAVRTSSAEANVEGLAGIQAKDIIGMMSLQRWINTQAAGVMQTGLTQPGLVQEQTSQTEALGFFGTAVQEGLLAKSGITLQSSLSASEGQNVQLDGAEIMGLDTLETVSAEGAALQEASENSANANLMKELSTGEENTDSAAAVKDEKNVPSDALSVKPQSHQTTVVKAEAAERAGQTGEMKSEYADMLKDMIAKQIINGNKELEIKLTPRSLGDLTVKVSYQDGAAAVSIICSDKKALQAMSQKAGELGLILENNLGSRTEVIVETRQDQQGRLYEDGRGQQSYNGQQSSGQQHSDKKQNETETIDFLQQLRLGIRKESEYIWQ